MSNLTITPTYEKPTANMLNTLVDRFCPHNGAQTFRIVGVDTQKTTHLVYELGNDPTKPEAIQAYTIFSVRVS